MKRPSETIKSNKKDKVKPVPAPVRVESGSEEEEMDGYSSPSVLETGDGGDIESSGSEEGSDEEVSL